MKLIQADSPGAAGGWRAHLALAYQRRGSATILRDNRHHGPLRVQRPLYPEGDAVCHTYLLHPPGGIVGGDLLELEASVATGGHALLTTPGAGKFYRAGGRSAEQRVRLTATDATLEWLPQETILYPGAEAKTRLDIHLFGSARFIGWEILCLGLPARGETLGTGHFHGRLQLFCDRRPLFVDHLRLDSAEALSGPAGLRAQPVTACLLATGVDGDTARILANCDKPDGGLTGTTLIGEVFLARYLGPSTAEAKAYFIHLWEKLRHALLGRPASPPRIWQT